MSDFSGFPRDFFTFFEDLAGNNNRPWFQENKQRYYDSVVNPISEFIVCMAPELRRISRHYIADPKPHGGSMFRIYRDTRFSKDKTPYKTHAGVQFRHEAGKDAHAPGFYVHLAAEGLYFGGGVWRPAGPQLGLIRDAIVDNARSWSRIVGAAKVQAAGGLKGDSLKRPPRGYDPEHRHVEDLKRKSFYVMAEAPSRRALKPGFVGEVAGAFRAAAPLNRFIAIALDLPF
ncbi:MAG: DUF2461 domain-containing protein [Gammaproteobacteria bacterium]|nr:DUF2461 domain-containing protein [Gammaproteobacteria bacterium]